MTIADRQSGDVQTIADTREETRTEDRQCGGEETLEDTQEAIRKKQIDDVEAKRQCTQEKTTKLKKKIRTWRHVLA